jgi:predicted nucleic acid-binding protein
LKNRFIDTNVFIYGLLKLDKELDETEIRIKENAAGIIERVYNGERVGISMAQVSEVANILEAYAPEHALILEDFLINMPSITVYGVNREIAQKAYQVVLKYHSNKIGLNDSIAYVLMMEHGYGEIYSFDKDFDILSGVKRIVE